MHEEQLKYTQALQELESLVQQIESGQMSVDELTQAVKRATELIQFCKARLRDTQQQVNEVLNKIHE
jgi:exodeoxyribonuclease VII small subunit